MLSKKQELLYNERDKEFTIFRMNLAIGFWKVQSSSQRSGQVI